MKDQTLIEVIEEIKLIRHQVPEEDVPEFDEIIASYQQKAEQLGATAVVGQVSPEGPYYREGGIGGAN